LVRAGVTFLDSHPAHVVGEVISSAGVEEPRLTGACLVGGRITSTVVLVLERLVETLFALERVVSPVRANLALRPIATAAALATTAVAATTIAATTTAPLIGTVAALTLWLLLLTGQRSGDMPMACHR
jgi:hypothetical protein